MTSFPIQDCMLMGTLQDFIVVQLCPPHPERAAIAEHQFSHPIRLVTDTYRDAPEHPSSR